MDLTARARFHIAAGYDPAAPDTWVWEDRSADVNHADGITITGGRPDEVSEIEAGSASLQIDNAGGHYCTYNPLGRWYGLLARGCPARWGTISGAAAFGTAASNGWGAPDIGDSWTLQGTLSTWSVSGGVGQKTIAAVNTAAAAILNGANARNGDATFVCYSSVIATGGPLIYGLQVRRVDDTDYLMFNVELSTSGSISAKIRRVHGGSSPTLATNEPLAFTYSVNQRIKARCQWDGPNLRLKVWPEASAEPAAWTVTATDNLCTGSNVAVYLWRYVTNTNAGSLTFFVDDLEIEAVEIVGTVSEWPVEWDPTATVSWAPIQIGGITRDLSQGQEALRSPIYRQLSGLTLPSGQPYAQGYWPLEDGQDATQAASALTRGAPAALTGGTFGSTDCPPGAASAVTLSTTGSSSVSGVVGGWTIPTDGYAGMFYFRLPTAVVGGTGMRMFEMTASGTIYRWVLYINDVSFTLEAYLPDGSLSFTSGPSLVVVDPTKWVAVQLETGESGATVTWSLLWHQVGGTVFYTMNGSYSGSANQIYSGTVVAAVDGMLVSHLWLGDDLLPFVATVFMAVSNGYAGETAAARIARLGTEEGVPVAVESGASEPLGPQRVGGFLDLLRSAEAADLGVLYESGSGLGYRPRGARYNRPIAAALTIGAAGDIADPPPRPTDDDQRLRNYWTVSREGGSSATASDAASIAKSRRRPDSATINIFSDAPLTDHASWRVHLGTVAEMRWPQITIDLTDRPTLLTAWRGRPHGPRITIGGIPAQGPIGDLAHLVVEGWTQEITSHSWRVTLNCSPARPWDVGVFDDPVRRQDSASTTLGAAYGSSDTALVFLTALIGDVWSTVSTPYDVVVSGERLTVTAMAAASQVISQADGTFEAGVGTWAGYGGTFAQSAVQAHGGTKSGLLTVTGSPSQAYARAAGQRIAPSTEYRARMWVWVASTRNVLAVFDWLDSGGGYISGASSTTSVTGGVWTQLTVTGTTPANAVYAQYGPTLDSSPANGTLLYLDDVDMLVSASYTGNAQKATVTRAVNGIAKALPAAAEVHMHPDQLARYAL